MAWTLRYSLPKILLAAVAVLSVALIFTASSALHQRIVDMPIYVPVNHTVYINKTTYLNRTVYVQVPPIYVNHTIYLNKTIYVTKPIYINKTVYLNNTVYVPTPVTNGTLGLIPGGQCGMESLVLPNGTMWTVGGDVFMPPPRQYGWLLAMLEAPRNESTPYEHGVGVAGFLNVRTYPINLMASIPVYTGFPYVRPANWSDYMIFGDVIGGAGDIMGLNYSSIGIPLNSSKLILIILSSQDPLYSHLLILPCNWTVIGVQNPRAALNTTITAPGFKLADEEDYYWYYGHWGVGHLSWGILGLEYWSFCELI